jgi:hypothetical protein
VNWASDEEREDERAQAEGICGVTRVTGKTEWICIKGVHGTVYRRRQRRGFALESNYGVDQHYFVNRFPWRKR